MRVWSVGLCALLWWSSVQADVINSNSGLSYASLSEAQTAANVGDVLVLDDGTYDVTSGFFLDKNLTIRAANRGKAILHRNSASGPVVQLQSDGTLDGLIITGGSIGFLLRDQGDVTGTLTNVVFDGQVEGITHDNSGGTAGTINASNITMYNISRYGIAISDGGTVSVSNALFVNVVTVAMANGNNLGANTIIVSDFLTENISELTDTPTLVTFSGEVTGAAELADPENGEYARLQGAVSEGVLGALLTPVPRQKILVKSNNLTIANNDSTPSLADGTDFGTTHETGVVQSMIVANDGFSETVSLTGANGDYVQLSGSHADQFAILSQPASNQLAPRTSQSFDVFYTPNSVGNHTAVVTIPSNATVDSNYQFAIQGENTNQNPVAVDDNISTDEDQSLALDPRSNDLDGDSDVLSIVDAQLTSGEGSVSHTSTSVTYDPEANFNGAATVSYEVADSYARDSATINITVNPVNDAPVAVGDTAITLEDAAVTVNVLANDTDVENSPLRLLSATVITGLGSASVVDGQVRIIPAANFNGSMAVEYQISDGQLTHVGSISVTVTPVNDAPVAVDDTATTDQQTKLVLDVLDNDIEVDRDSRILASAQLLSGQGNAFVSGNRLHFEPSSEFAGVVQVRYEISDGQLSDFGVVTITVEPAAVEGSIPVGDIPGIDGIPLLRQALSVLPIDLVPGYQESTDVVSEITRYALVGQASITIPSSLNFPELRLNGADLLVYSERGGETPLNSFFVKISLYEFLKRTFGTTALPQELIDLVPDVPVIIAYSDLNQDGKTLADLPLPVREFFNGILDTNFGVPIFNDTGSFNLFIGGIGYEAIPAVVRNPLEDLGITAQFIEDNLGLGGRVVYSVSVSNIAQIIDALAFILPQAQPAGFSLSGIPALEFSVILPGLSLPDWLTAGASQIPAVQALAFEPSGAAQLRYMLGIPDVDFSKGELVGLAFDVGFEGAFRIQMPNLINADSLRDAPGREPLDVRGTITQGLEANLEGDGSEVGGSMTGTLNLVNEWVNPLGIPGVAIGNAVLFVGGAASAGAKVTNAGAGIDIDIGMGGDFACLSDTGERLGSASMAGYLGLKLGVAVPITGFGVSVNQPAMQFAERLKCGLRVQLGTVLGMADTLVALVPEPTAKQAIRELNSQATGSVKNFLDQVIEVPLQFAPIGAALDQFRFQESNLYFATPGIELPGHFDGLAFRMGGGAEYRTSRTSNDWISIGRVDFSGGIISGIHGDLSLADYNIADLIVMENVKAGIDLQIWPPEAGLQFSGRQQLFGLNTESNVVMSPDEGIKLVSMTAIQGLGRMAVDAESFGRLDQWPPVEPFDMRGSTELQIDLNVLSGALNSVVGNITGDAARAYRDALDRLSREASQERVLIDAISRIEADVRNTTDRVNRELRPRFDWARARLYDGERAIDYFYSRARSFERSLDRRAWWDWGGKAYDWAQSRANWALYEIARRAIPALRDLLNSAERALNAALYDVVAHLEPRANALRISLATVRAAKQLVFVTVQGLEAANNAARSVSDALRNATNITLHDASARISSLAAFQLGTSPLALNLDFELGSVGLRCQKQTDFFLSNPVGGVIEGVQGIFAGCASNRINSENQSTRAALVVSRDAPTLASSQNENPEPPLNDSVQNAQALSSDLPVQLAGTTKGAQFGDAETDNGLFSAAVWYAFTPATTGIYTIEAIGEDTALEIYHVEAGLPDRLLAADLRPVKSAKISLELEADQDYLFAVSSQFADPGNFTLTVNADEITQVAVDNDTFAQALTINTRSGTATTTNFAASVEANETAGDALPIHNSLWWRFEAPIAGLYTFETLGSEVDTVLRGYTATSSATSVADLTWLKTANDLGLDPASSLSLRLAAGQVLWVSLASRYPTFGTVQLNWRYVDGVAIELVGDDFSAPLEIPPTSEQLHLDSSGASSELGEPLHAGVSNAASLWLSLKVDETAEMVFDTRGSSFDTVLAVYSGASLDTLQAIAANDDEDERNSSSRVRVTVQANQLYRIAIAGKDEGEGKLVFNYAEIDPNDNFSGASGLVGNGRQRVELTDATLETFEPDYSLLLADAQSPDALLGSLAGALNATGDSADAPPPPGAAELQQLASDLYENVLTDLRNRPLERSVWYEYVAAETGDLQLITSADTDVDSALFVFRGDDLQNLELLAAVDDVNGTLGATVRLAVQQGEKLKIAVTSRQPGFVELDYALVPLDQQTVANGTPQSAIEIPLSDGVGQVQGDNTYSVAAGIPVLLGDQSDKRLWWRFTTLETGFITLNSAGSGVDTLLEVYKPDVAGDLVLIALNDNYQGDDSASRVRLAVQQGETYLVAVDSLYGQLGSVSLELQFSDQGFIPANDQFANAAELSGDAANLRIDSQFASYQLGEPQLGAFERPNFIWYRYQSTANGVLTISTDGSNFDTILGLFQGTANNLERLDSNDDVDLERDSSRLSYVVATGETYYIAIAGKRGVQGELALSFELSPIELTELPANSLAANSLEVTEGQVQQRLAHLSDQPESGSSLVRAIDGTASSRWYQWLAPESGSFLVSSEGSEIIPLLEVYAGTAADQLVLLNKDSGEAGSGRFSAVRFNADQGQRYFVRVASRYAEQGEITLAFTRLGQTEDSGIPVIPGVQGGQLPAAITAEGVFEYQFVAAKDGLVLVSLQNGDEQSHELQIYLESESGLITVNEVELPVPAEFVGQSGLATQFEAEQGQSYRLRVVATAPVLGNAAISFAYQSAPEVNLESAELKDAVSQVESILLSQADNILAGLVDAELLRSEILSVLAGLIERSGSVNEDLQLSIVGANGWIELTLSDRTLRQVLLSLMLPVTGVDAAHRQITVGDANFTSISHEGQVTPIALQFPLSAFEATIRQVFASVNRLPLSTVGDVPERIAQFQPGSLYDIQVNAFDANIAPLQLEALEVVDGVLVRLPIDSGALIGWLEDESLSIADAQRQINLALRQGALRIVRADTAVELLGDELEALETLATVNLNEGYVEFSTRRFSAFALVAVAAPDTIVDSPDVDSETPEPITVAPSRSGRGGCSVGGVNQGFDPVLPLLLFAALFSLWFRRRVGG